MYFLLVPILQLVVSGDGGDDAGGGSGGVRSDGAGYCSSSVGSSRGIGSNGRHLGNDGAAAATNVENGVF